MFRKSKRDKERKGSSIASDSAEGEHKNGTLKRHSKLFSFGKKDKKKAEQIHAGLESPLNADTDGIRIEESFEHKSQRIVNKHSFNPVVEENIQTEKTKSRNNSVQKNNRQDSNYKSTSSAGSRRLSSSGSLSLNLDFGTDSSLTFQSFTADVLRATEEKLSGVDLKLPDIKTEPNNDSSRTVTVKRNSAGDYGFAFRRSTVKKEESEKVIHFVEPAESESSLGLLPGDRLVAVDGVNVENCDREEIIQKVATAGDSVTLKVVPVPELSELSSRTAALQKHSPQLRKISSMARSGSLRARMLQTSKTEKDIAFEKSWRETEKVWLIHKGGFSSGVLSKAKNKDDETYSYKVTLDHGGEVVEVEEDAVEKLNPPQFDRVEDLSTLRHLNESGCLHTLRQRYAGNLTHTYAGNKLIIIKPKEKLGVYTEKVMQMFRGCKHEDMPPHIYAIAQTAYHSMFASNVNQSIVMLGSAGSGKTFNSQQLIRYLTTVAISHDSNATVTKMEAALSILESFTHARTILSHNASFCGFLYSLDFDASGLVIGSSIQNYFLDKGRASRIFEGESSYRIFYELMDGCTGKLQQDLMLDSLTKQGNQLFDFEQQFSNKDAHSQKWLNLISAFETLHISSDEIKGILTPLAAILHLGAAGITSVPGAKSYFAHPSYAQKAAAILGTTEENLARGIFTTAVHVATRSRSGSSLSRTGSNASRSSIVFNKPGEASKSDLLSPAASLLSVDTIYEHTLISLESFTAGLYVEAFTALMRLVNRSLNTAGRVASIINIYDGPGFQNKSSVDKNNNLEDLRSNYCYEKLQWLMHFSTFTLQIDRYNRENIDFSYSTENIISPEHTIAVMDKLSVDRRISHGEISDAKGLFWIIEEEAIRSNSNEIALVEKIRSQHSGTKDGSLISTNPNLPEIFMVSHLQNSVAIKYNVNGWLKRVREHPSLKMPYSILSDSSKSYITELYAGHQSGTFNSESSSHGRGARRKSQHVISSVRRNSSVMQLKAQMERILEVLNRTSVRFVYCFLPDPTDGLYDPNLNSNTDIKAVATLNVPFVRQQLTSAYLLESMRIHRQGYPDHMTFTDFQRRFGLLLSKEHREENGGSLLDEKQSVLTMVEKLDLEERSYKLGLSQIFFRAGILPQLEDTRDDSISGLILGFQARCRGVIARKKLKTRKLQYLAIRCLQRNVRKFALVRNWEWWRLYTKVLPLLDVHRTEKELKSKTSELGSLNSTIDKLEKENKEHTDENTRLKKKVQELSSQLSEIHSSASGTGELLDHETSERIRLEEELEQAKMETGRLTEQFRQLESEYCDIKVNSISNGGYRYDGDGVGADEFEENDNVWREKYKALSRELELTRRKMTDQSEEEIQELMNQKRISEKALAEERSESDEVRRQLTNNKRKLVKLNTEMDDMKLLLESVQGRNSELEKKQRKFDHDMQNLVEELDQEKILHETSQRERDKYSTEKYALQNTINERDDEISQLKRKVTMLNEEIDDYGTTGKSDAELVTMKRQLRELEVKGQDQEEELDEQAGQIQQLDQAKLKLEMASQRDKQQYQRDLETKDEDIEQLKVEYNRKLRALEEQLEEEIKRRDDVNKAKRELERRVFDLQNSVEEVDKGTERKLKKELKRLRILYKDAKAALENQQAKGGDQTELKALRNQLEDCEFAKHVALKAKVQIETDLEELTNQNDNLSNAREAIEERCLALSRENVDLQTSIDEAEDEIEDVNRNNKQLIAQLSESQNLVLEIKEKYRILEDEKDVLMQKVDALTLKLESNHKNLVERSEVDRLEFKNRELEARMETDTATKIKLEHQVNRLKGQFERIQDERSELQNNQSRIQQVSSRFERQTKEYRAELESLKRQEADHKRRREEAENRLQNLEEEFSRKKLELSLADKRIRDLQESFEQEMNASTDEDISLDDLYESDDSLTSSATRRRPSSTRRNRPTLSKRYSADSFDNSYDSFRNRRSVTGDDSYIINGSLLGKDSKSNMTPRTASRTTSRTITRQGSYE